MSVARPELNVLQRRFPVLKKRRSSRDAAHHLFLAAVLAIGAASLGCATRTGGPGQLHDETGSTSKAGLESRVLAYWDRRQAKDLAGAYTFYCSAYKKRVPQAEFLKLTRLTRFDLRDIRVIKVDQTGDRAEVSLSLRFVMPSISPDPLAGQSTETWLRETEGQWCKVDEQLLLPFPRSGGPQS